MLYGAKNEVDKKEVKKLAYDILVCEKLPPTGFKNRIYILINKTYIQIFMFDNGKWLQVSSTASATGDIPGLVKPDEDTITVDVDGTIHANKLLSKMINDVPFATQSKVNSMYDSLSQEDVSIKSTLTAYVDTLSDSVVHSVSVDGVDVPADTEHNVNIDLSAIRSSIESALNSLGILTTRVTSLEEKAGISSAEHVYNLYASEWSANSDSFKTDYPYVYNISIPTLPSNSSPRFEIYGSDGKYSDSPITQAEVDAISSICPKVVCVAGSGLRVYATELISTSLTLYMIGVSV